MDSLAGAEPGTTPVHPPPLNALVQAVAAAVGDMQRRARRAPDTFPTDSLALLREAGALLAPLPSVLGGLGLGTEPAAAEACAAVLSAVGEASLPLGRVFEAHVNAVRLIVRLGDDGHHRWLRERLHAGALFALWVTDGDDASAVAGRTQDGLMHLSGSKSFCSAAGYATDALLTARLGGPAPSLLAVTLGMGERVTPGGVGLSGMSGSATGVVAFDGVTIPASAVVGAPGDYLREPDLSAGAWRGSAVAWGGLRALTAEVRRQLLARGRDGDPHQQTRFGLLLIAGETARHFVLEAARRAESAGEASAKAADAVAYVHLARMAVERACLDGMELAQRGLGLQAFVRTNPVSRLCGDLSVYLRQPAPDEVLTEAASHGFARAAFP